MSKQVKLYFDLLSQPSRALFMVFNLARIPVIHQPVALRKRAQLTPEFKAINRFQKVPCIVDHDGFKLSESIAILRYLDQKGDFPYLRDLYPNDLRKRAKIDEFLEWQHNGVRLHCGTYFELVWRMPLVTGKPSPAAEVKKSREEMIKILDFMENVWLGDGNRFLTGEKLTVADIWGACEVEQPRMAGFEPREGRPLLEKWLAEVQKATNPVYDEAHEYLRRAEKKFKSQN
ncbi:glutathione S-transferase theta-1-like [Culicoides brevitarsis]|uniref:glutathione S-transferase theta-1-like n=1 Tax=Culicoides brevitarsis TaxID=469753 RepID=UPI00307B9D63